MTKIIITISVLVLLTACGRGGFDDYKAPESTDISQVFETACAECHGSKGGGMFFGLFFTLEPGGKSSQELAAKILSGGEGMPAFLNLTESQRLKLAEYVLEIRQ